MRLLVVHAHPVEESFNKALFRAFAGEAAGAGHEVRRLDLYAEGFNPVMGRDERLAYNDAHINEPRARGHIDHIRWCEGLVFVYPTWWFGLPAMLKGWLDRVWVPHVAFGLPTPETPRLEPRMQHIRLLGGISTYGATWLVTRWVGDPGRRTIMRGMKPLCRPRCRTFWHALHRMDTLDRASRERFLARVAARARRLPG